MPISTPVDVGQQHRDEDHFAHVLTHLFEPAILAAGLSPVPPAATGSDLIHAQIVRKLETSGLVLCDMSTLNANVFFELGIRTAVDKPVCLVRDGDTKMIPFDTGVINTHQYDGSLQPWHLAEEIEKLTAHIEASVDGSASTNTMWQYFGLTSKASFKRADETGEGEKIDFLMAEVAGLSAAIRSERPGASGFKSDSFGVPDGEAFLMLTERVLGDDDLTSERMQLVYDGYQLLAGPQKQLLSLTYGLHGSVAASTKDAAEGMGKPIADVIRRRSEALTTLRRYVMANDPSLAIGPVKGYEER